MDLPVQMLTGEASPKFSKGPVEGPEGNRPFQDRANSPRREFVEEGESGRSEEHGPCSETVSICSAAEILPSCIVYGVSDKTGPHIETPSQLCSYQRLSPRLLHHRRFPLFEASFWT